MGDIIDYAKTHQEETFDQFAFNEADSLILSELSYMNFRNTPFCRDSFSVTLSQFLNNKETSDRITKGMLSQEKDIALLSVLAASRRYGSIRACAFTESTDTECEKQFCAILFSLSDHVYYIAYRGTDDSFVGWKEDLNLSFLPEIPAQVSARQYCTRLMYQYPGCYYLGGHSKGGNLAIYAAMHQPTALLPRVLAVYNHDGPGFLPGVYQSGEYLRIHPLIYKTVPQSSIVGLLLEQHDNYTVIQSSAFGIMQHDPYSWITDSNGFVVIEQVDTLSKYTNLALNNWISSLDLETRKRFVDALYDTITATGATTTTELLDNRFEHFKSLIEKIRESDPEEKKLVHSVIRALIRSSRGEMRHLITDIPAARP